MKSVEDITVFTSASTIMDLLGGALEPPRKSIPEHIEVVENWRCRPGDVETLMPFLRHKFYLRCVQALAGRKIWEWRIPPEEITWDAMIVTRYAVDGNVRDKATDRKCFADTNWKGIKIRGRFVVESSHERL